MRAAYLYILIEFQRCSIIRRNRKIFGLYLRGSALGPPRFLSVRVRLILERSEVLIICYETLLTSDRQLQRRDTGVGGDCQRATEIVLVLSHYEILFGKTEIEGIGVG